VLCYNDRFSDFTVKLVDVESKEQKQFSGHEAPVLSVALHPDEQLFVSRLNYFTLNRSCHRATCLTVEYD